MDAKLSKEVNVKDDNSEMDLYIDCQDDDIMGEEEMQEEELYHDDFVEFNNVDLALENKRTIKNYGRLVDFRDYLGYEEDELEDIY